MDEDQLMKNLLLIYELARHDPGSKWIKARTSDGSTVYFPVWK